MDRAYCGRLGPHAGAAPNSRAGRRIRETNMNPAPQRSGCKPFAFIAALAMSLTIGLCAPADEIHVPDPVPDIQSAVDVATDGDVIIVAPGTYSESVFLFGKEITIRSSDGPEVTTLDGSGLGKSIITATGGETLATVIDGFTLTNGEATVFANCVTTGPTGGAILVDGASLTVLGCLFTNNMATTEGHGGAIYVQPDDDGLAGELIVRDSTFISNGLLATRGGAIMNCEGMSLEVTGCTFESNGFHSEKTGTWGGAIHVIELTVGVTISDCVFRDHGASHGGGIFVSIIEQTTQSSITNCAFTDNFASFGAGIELALGQESQGSITDCTFLNNIASHGAGIMAVIGQNSTLDIERCGFADGQAAFGAGANLSTYNGTEEPVNTHVSVRDCTFTNNHGGFGGGLFALALAGVLEVDRCRFDGNIADPAGVDVGNFANPCWVGGPDHGKNGEGLFYGGGAVLYAQGSEFDHPLARASNCVFVNNTVSIGRAGGVELQTCEGGVVEMVNCTVLNNGDSGVFMAVGSKHPLDGTPSSVRVSNSIIRGHVVNVEFEEQDEVAIASVEYSNIEGGFAGVGNIDADPSFVDATGGDYRLTGGSPAIDAGDNTALPEGIDTDLDGNPRFVDDADTKDTGNGRAPLVDMGAYEFQGEGGGEILGDLDGDGSVGTTDLLLLLGAWDACDDCDDCIADLDGDCIVGGFDLILLLGNWG